VVDFFFADFLVAIVFSLWSVMQIYPEGGGVCGDCCYRMTR
jgi:hypothetical protein